MLKLLIVEDQKKDLEGICGILKWDSLGIEISGTAMDGQEGLQKALEIKPQIIITDVVMPIMDGLALMEEAKAVLPNTKFIITSCYDEFSYIRRALDMNAVGYVLKPIIASDLHKVIVKAIDICNSERQKELGTEFLEKRLKDNLPIMRESFLKNIAYGIYKDEDILWDNIEFLGLNICKGMLFGILYLEIDEYEVLTEKYTTKDRYLMLEGIKSIMEERLSGKQSGYVITVDESHISILMVDEKQASESLENKNMLDFAAALSNDLNQQLKISVTIGVSHIVDNLLALELCFSQARDATKLKFQLGRGQIITAEDRLLPKGNVKYTADKLLQELKTLMFSGDQESICRFVDRAVTDYTDGCRETYTQFICISIINYMQMILMEMNESLKSAIDDENIIYENLAVLETVIDIKHYLTDILTLVQKFITNRMNLRNRRIVEKIEEIVKNRYAENLSINDIAPEIFFSPSYTSYIFKQETGKNFTEYLTKVRIDKSLELLENKNLKIHEIAELVGYNNKSYFCAVFRERTGVTPKEYREKLW